MDIVGSYKQTTGLGAIDRICQFISEDRQFSLVTAAAFKDIKLSPNV